MGDTFLTPLTVAIYTARYGEIEMAQIVADELAVAWRVPMAVVHAEHADTFALFDLSEDSEDGAIRETALYIVEPPLRLVGGGG